MKFRSTGVKVYLLLTALAACLVLANSLWAWQSREPLRYALYLAGAAVVSQMKVRLPAVTGTLSVNFLFILIGIIELNLSETLVIGAVGMVAQSLWRAQARPTVTQVIFNLSHITLASAAAYLIYHSALVRSLDDTLAMRLFFATGTFFLFNTCAVAAIIALTEAKSLWEVWHESFMWTAPEYLVGAAVAALFHVANVYLGWQIAILTVPPIYLVYRSYNLYLGGLEEEKRHVTEMAELHWRTVEALALAIDAKDSVTHDHLRRVQVYAMEIGQELGLSQAEMQALKAAALLHDIGKLAVPEHILGKPGKLTAEEFEKIKIHPLVGAEILERVRFPYPVVPIVRAHHEKWDGTGYPCGLKGENIPLGARILSVADCLDALSSDRQYRRALPLPEAMEKVAAESGKGFDPRVIEVLRRRSADLEIKIRARPANEPRLSASPKAESAGAPAAGFEIALRTPELAGPNEGELLSSIAAARQEFQSLFEITRELGGALRLDEILSLVAARLKSLVPHHALAIYLRREDTLIPEFVNGEDQGLFSRLRIPLGQGLSGWVAKHRKPIINGDPSVETACRGDLSQSSHLRSALSVPLEGPAGAIGALTLYHAGPDAFTGAQVRVLLAISSKAGFTIEAALKRREAEQFPVRDELTGLPNARSLFVELDRELARARRTDSPLAILAFGVDGFRQVNDRFGYLAGNRVLQVIGNALRESCREYDYVARMGGDEFVVLLPGTRPEVAQSRIQDLLGIAAEAGRRVCGESSLSMSAGDAFSPQDGSDAEQLLAEADRRLYRAKQLRKTGARLPLAVKVVP